MASLVSHTKISRTLSNLSQDFSSLIVSLLKCHKIAIRAYYIEIVLDFYFRGIFF